MDRSNGFCVIILRAVCDSILIPEPINKSKYLHSYLWYDSNAMSRHSIEQNATLAQSQHPIGDESLEIGGDYYGKCVRFLCIPYLSKQ